MSSLHYVLSVARNTFRVQPLSVFGIFNCQEKLLLVIAIVHIRVTLGPLVVLLDAAVRHTIDLKETTLDVAIGEAFQDDFHSVG